MFAPLRMVVHVLLLYVNSLPSVPQSPSGEVESQEGEMLNGNLMLVVMSLRCYVISSFSIGQFNVRHYFKLVFNYWPSVNRPLLWMLTWEASASLAQALS